MSSSRDHSTCTGFRMRMRKVNGLCDEVRRGAAAEAAAEIRRMDGDSVVRQPSDSCCGRRGRHSASELAPRARSCRR